MAKTITVYCLSCGIRFEATRKTATFCGGTCRQRFNRAINAFNAKLTAEGLLRPTPTEPAKLEVAAGDIAAVCTSINTLAEKVKGQFLFDEAISALSDALEILDGIVNPFCEICGERRADGWENIEYCRRCEIETFELVCSACEKRKPSVASEDMLCRQCEKDNKSDGTC